MSPARPVVLVHGAWQTAATWDLVAPRLRDCGLEVHTAALAGLQGRAGELTGEISLAMHVAQVCDLLAGHDLRECVLAGHSYGGMVISGVAERQADRVGHLVYVDAFVPRPQQSVLDMLPAALADRFRAQAAADNGWRLAAGEQQLDLWGLPPGPARDFVRARLSDFSIRCFEGQHDAAGGVAGAIPTSYVACSRASYPARPVFAPFADRARLEGWPVHEMDTGHDCQAEAPDALSGVLLTIAAESRPGDATRG